MATHFFGITDRTFAYSHTVGRNEFGGTGFRNPVDLAVADNDVVYVVNRSYENRPDGVRVSIVTHDEELIGEFGRSSICLLYVRVMRSGFMIFRTVYILYKSRLPIFRLLG